MFIISIFISLEGWTWMKNVQKNKKLYVLDFLLLLGVSASTRALPPAFISFNWNQTRGFILSWRKQSHTSKERSSTWEAVGARVLCCWGSACTACGTKVSAGALKVRQSSSEKEPTVAFWKIFFLTTRRQQFWSAVTQFSRDKSSLLYSQRSLNSQAVGVVAGCDTQLPGSDRCGQWRSHSTAVISQGVFMLLANTQGRAPLLRLYVRSAHASVPTQSFPHPRNKWHRSFAVPAWPIYLTSTPARVVVN